MRIVTLLGTRPEIIRLSRVIPHLDEVADHHVVHTGQNFDERLSEVFFDELGLRPPDHHLGIRAGGFGAQAGAILTRCEAILNRLRPDRLLILGDTNSGLAALPARRLGIPVYHMEAGNRCWDERVPEEINRRVIDHASSILLPYTERSRQNLLAEGIDSRRILVTGNPIREVLRHYGAGIAGSGVLARLGLDEQNYVLVTAHRAENVDPPERLRALFATLATVRRECGWRVVVSLHPRTRERGLALGLNWSAAGLEALPPFGLFDFVRLEQSAWCVLSDSGTVQEETCLLGVPNVTLRETTERPETIECGSGILAGLEAQAVLEAIECARARRGAWSPPREYLVENVSATIGRILLSQHAAAPRPATVPRPAAVEALCG